MTAALSKRRDLPISDSFSLPLAMITERIGWLGQSGSGKSYAAMKLAELMLMVGAQVIPIDPIGCWWGLRASRDGKREGLPISIIGGEHGDVPVTASGGAIVAETLATTGASAIIDLSDFTNAEFAQFCIAFAEAFWKAKKRSPSPVHLFCEEAHNLMPQSIPPADNRVDPKKSPAVMLNRWDLLARQGRGKGIGMSIITQQPQSVSKRALNQCGTVFAMRTMGSQERKAIDLWIGDKATDRAQLDLGDRLPDLETGEAWVASPHFLKVFRTVQISKRETFDSSKTPEFGVELAAPKMLAKVDAEQLRAAMVEEVARVERDDPAKLRQQLDELRRKLDARPMVVIPAPKSERVEVPILRPSDLKRLEQLGARVTAASERAALATERVAAAHAELGTALAAVKRLGDAPPPVYGRRYMEVREAETSQIATVKAPPARLERREQLGKTALTGKANDMVAALAWHDMGRAELGVWVGMDFGGGGFRTYLSHLNSAGFIEGDPMRLTDAGRAYWRDVLKSAGAGTPSDVHARWAQKMTGKARAMLEHLIAHRGQWISRQDLAAAVEMDAGGGGFRTYLSHLNSPGLIVTKGSMVMASERLFGEGP